MSTEARALAVRSFAVHDDFHASSARITIIFARSYEKSANHCIETVRAMQCSVIIDQVTSPRVY